MFYVMVELAEFLELRIIESVLDMKGNRDSTEYISSYSFVVISEIDEHCLFITDVEVIFESVVDFNGVALVYFRMRDYAF